MTIIVVSEWCCFLPGLVVIDSKYYHVLLLWMTSAIIITGSFMWYDLPRCMHRRLVHHHDLDQASRTIK